MLNNYNIYLNCRIIWAILQLNDNDLIRMVNESYEKSKQPLAFSKNQVEKAGRLIRKNEGDFEHAIEVVQNFRAAHLYPLQIMQ